MNTSISKHLKRATVLGLIAFSLSACDKFVFGDIHPNYDDNPLNTKTIPHVRIIADTKDGEAKCYEDVRRFYPSVQRSELWRMLSDPEAFFYRYRRNVVLM